MLEEIERVYRTGYPTYLRVACAITDSPDLGHDAVQRNLATLGARLRTCVDSPMGLGSTVALSAA